MTLSGPKAWRGLMNDVKIFPHFLHSAREVELVSAYEFHRRAGRVSRVGSEWVVVEWT